MMRNASFSTRSLNMKRLVPAWDNDSKMRLIAAFYRLPITLNSSVCDLADIAASICASSRITFLTLSEGKLSGFLL
jgi:hypothetical protein